MTSNPETLTVKQLTRIKFILRREMSSQNDLNTTHTKNHIFAQLLSIEPEITFKNKLSGENFRPK